MMSMETLQEVRGVRQIKFRVTVFDADKKAVRRCMREAMHVENRVVRLGQLVQSEHAEHRGERRAENGKLKSDGNESRPTIERAAANVHRISDRHCPVLKTKTAQAPGQATKQSNRGHEVALQAQRLRETFDGKGGIGIETAIACLADFLHGMNELLGCLELTHHAVDMGALQTHYFSSSEVSATSSRISAMEIAGRTRTNRKIRVTNMPIVPMNVAQSQNVALYRPQAEGTKSRVRLMTTMTKRSSHMPIFTTIDMMKRTATLWRILYDQRSCGSRMLHIISA